MAGKHTDGLSQHASGLYVPDALARRRVVIPKEDWRVLDRAIKVFVRLEMRIAFGCKNRACPAPSVERATQVDGTPLLRCGCTDRVMLR